MSRSHRNLVLQKEKEQERDQHEQSVQRLSAKHEMDMSHLNQEHALSAAKVDAASVRIPMICRTIVLSSLTLNTFQATEVMEEFEKMIAQLKLELLDAEHRRHQQVQVRFP